MGSTTFEQLVGTMQIQTAHRSDALRPLRFPLLGTLVLSVLGFVLEGGVWAGPLLFLHGVLTGIYVGLYFTLLRRSPGALYAETFEGPLEGRA